MLLEVIGYCIRSIKGGLGSFLAPGPPSRRHICKGDSLAYHFDKIRQWVESNPEWTFDQGKREVGPDKATFIITYIRDNKKEV